MHSLASLTKDARCLSAARYWEALNPINLDSAQPTITRALACTIPELATHGKGIQDYHNQRVHLQGTAMTVTVSASAFARDGVALATDF